MLKMKGKKSDIFSVPMTKCYLHYTRDQELYRVADSNQPRPV